MNATLNERDGTKVIVMHVLL